MTWARTVDQLEVVFFSSLLAFAVLCVVATIVGTFTYLLTRDPVATAATAPTAMPNVKAERESHPTEARTAIAG